MALNSYDNILAAWTAGKAQDYFYNKASITTVANSFWSLWAAAGQPGAGAFGGTALAARAVSSSTTGALSFTNPTGPDILQMVSFTAASSVAAGSLLLVDRLLDYPTISCTVTTLQTMDNTATLPRYTTGAGVQMFAEVTTTLGATPQTLTITYVNQAGTTGRVTTLSPVTSSAVNRLPQVSFFIPLQAGDTGVRSITSVQFGGSMGAGVLNMTLCRPVVDLPIQVAATMVERNMVLHTPRLFQIVDNAALSFLLFSATTSSGALVGRTTAVAG
ncbi:MAG: hypothetical protein ACREXU_00625 [Gammaproteobacteria bacterium]